MRPKQEVLPGQVWADCDKRAEGRHVIVERVDDQYAYCTKFNRTTRSRFSSARVGGIRLLLRRMRPSSTGWRFTGALYPKEAGR